MANGYGTDSEITALLNKFDWIVVPSSNPDGYDYTWTTVCKEKYFMTILERLNYQLSMIKLIG